MFRVLRVSLLLSACCLVAPLARAQGPAPGPDAGRDESPVHLRDQGIHYLKMDKRDLARRTLEKALRLGGQDDERLILTLARLHHEDGNVERAFEVLEEGPDSERVLQFQHQLRSQYGQVRLIPAMGGSRRGPVALVPERPIINPERKAFFARVVADKLSGDVELPIDILLPAGRYIVNGRPVEPNPEGRCEVEVPFHRVALLLSPGSLPNAAAAAAQARNALGAEVRLVDLASAANAARAITEVAVREPALMIALGTEAVRRANEDLPGISMLALGVERAAGAAAIKRQGRSTGLWGDLNRGKLLERAKELSPSMERVGVLFRRAYSWEAYQQALAERPDGIRLVPIPVTTRRSVAGALLKARAEIDAVWIPRDPELFDDKAVFFIATWAQREKLPLLCEDLSLVDRGALLAGEPSLAGVFEEGLELARRILWDDEEPESLPPRGSSRVAWGLNFAVARSLGLEVPAAVQSELSHRSDEGPRSASTASK